MSTWRAVEVAGLPRRPDGQVDVLGVARGLDDPVLLETAGTAGWHYLAVRTIGRVADHGDGTTLVGPGGREDLGPDPFAALERVCERWGLVPDNRDAGPIAPSAAHVPAFTGGLVGAFAYDLARRVEHLPRTAVEDRSPTQLDLRLVDVVLACPPDDGPPLLLHRDLGAAPPHLDELARDVVARASRATPPAEPEPTTARSTLPRTAYLAAVREVLEHVAAGDTFQVNLAQRLTAPFTQDVWALYQRLREQSPAAFGAVLPGLVDGAAIASISPETFLGAIGRDVVVRPIKGTRPRHADPAADASAADELAASAKDRAENVMVVDMERNDLGRVCVPGSVHVPELLAVERHPTVWHLVSTVAGRLRPDVGWGELMRATFPCGSITGTPKVRAMEVIERLEPVRRSWYCGALGFLSAGGMSTSVTIRTAVLRPDDGEADYGAGGGIVAESDPGGEWQESLDKAAAFLRAVRADLDPRGR